MTGTDEDGDPLFQDNQWTFTWAINRDLNQSRSTISYAPDYGYREDSFSFVANDGSVDSEPATVSIWVYDPTSADLVSFEGAYKNGKNRIFWEINNPNDFLRFDLYRATSADGERIKRNEEMIFSTDRVYELFDHEIVLGQLYFYWLKCYDLYGNEIYKPYDPIEVRSGFQGFIPMIVN